MNFPLQIGHTFKRGEYMSPVFWGIPTQTHVKTRWPDGSNKYAILICYLLGNAGEARTLDIVEGLPVSGTKTLPVIDVAVETNGVRYTCADMPQHVVFEGPIASRVIFADYKSAEQIKPIIRVHYWHDLGLMDVRVVIENGNTEKAGEWKGRTFKIFIKGALVFEQAELIIPVGGTWTKEFRESANTNAKFNLSYLAASKAVPNFDASITPTENAIALRYQQWQASNKDLLLAKTRNWGNFPSAMGTAGARDDWGCYPAWTVLWLYSGDKRMREADVGNAELACMYGLMSFREGDPNRASRGRPIRIWDRPELQMSRPTQTGIKTIPGVDFDDWGLRPDPAHVPNPFFVLYLTTGDEFWVERMSLWVSYLMAYSNGGFRGKTGREGGIPGADAAIFQTRGQGLILRSLAELVWIMPDDSPDKAYYAQMLDDCITTWEGERNINPRSDPRWEFGRATFPQDSPLHFWNQGNDGMTSPPVDYTKCAVAAAQWEESPLAYGLLRARELDAPTQPLLDYLAPHFKQLGKYLCNYRIATKDSARNYFQTWEEVKAATNLHRYTGVEPYNLDEEWQVNRDLNQGYTTVAGQAVIATDDPAYWAQYKAEVYDKLNFAPNPKWAILPRQ